MKLIVMIPAYNEEKNIGNVIKEIKDNVKDYKVLVIDDGSTDKTVEVARKAGADFIISNKKNLGLAPTFRRGLEEALRLGADIIVNTDADYQYNQKQIPKLIKPILEGKADIVLTNRNIFSLDHMPLSKKIGNSIATQVTRLVSGFDVKDAQSGFRAFSREAALKLNVLSDYTYVDLIVFNSTTNVTDTFSDGESEKSLTFTGGENNTEYVRLPKDSTVIYSKIKIQGLAP